MWDFLSTVMLRGLVCFLMVPVFKRVCTLFNGRMCVVCVCLFCRYNRPQTMWMLTPIHVLLTIYVNQPAMALLDEPGCNPRVKFAMFELMSFFFPKVDVFRHIKDDQGGGAQNPTNAGGIASSSSSGGSSGDDNRGNVSARNAPTVDVANFNDGCAENDQQRNITLPTELADCARHGCKVVMSRERLLLTFLLFLGCVVKSCFLGACHTDHHNALHTCV